MNWQLEATEQFERDAKRYAKKQPGESLARGGRPPQGIAGVIPTNTHPAHTMKTATTPAPANQPKRFASVRDLVKTTAADADQVREFGFFGEAWFNLFKILCDATSKLPKDSEQDDDAPLMLLGGELQKFTVTGKRETALC